MLKFDICKDDPFGIKERIKKTYIKLPTDYIDLSRGDPYNPPDTLADSVFAGFLLWSLIVNDIIGDKALSRVSEEILLQAKSKLRDYPYVPLDLMDYVTEKISDYSGINRYELLKAIISGIRGEDYTSELGENPVRAIIAKEISNLVKPKQDIKPEDIILTIGASEAIGALIEVFMSVNLFEKNCDEKAKYKVAMLSPLYTPYKFIFDKLGIEVYPIAGNESNGFEPNEDELKKFEEKANEIRVLIIVNPGNPSGRVLSEKVLEKLADICKRNEIIIISDIVYAPFLLEPMSSIFNYASKLTILIGSGSKFYQETGTRFGFVVITEGADHKIAEIACKGLREFYGGLSLKKALVKAKGPDPVGTFYHTHHVPTPIQWMGAFRLMLGHEDARKFTYELWERWNALYHGLNLRTPKERFPEAKFVPYYALIDLKDVAQNNNLQHLKIKMDDKQITPEELLIKIFTDANVLVLPAATFFPGDECGNKWKVRFSVANQPLEKIQKATDNILSLFRKLN